MNRRKKKSADRPRRTRLHRTNRPRTVLLVLCAIILVIAAITISYLVFDHSAERPTSPGGKTISQSTLAGPQGVKGWRILYVNQGNARVDESNFSALITTVKSHAFNTIFFQVYRSGSLLFTTSELSYFITASHAENVTIFFSLYMTDSSDRIPSSIFSMGEDGISLDMSTLMPSSQLSMLSNLSVSYHGGKTAVTTTDLTSKLKPDLLILETYSPADRAYIHPGIIGSVEVLATSSVEDYEQQVQYCLTNSDGVMVFDYYGLGLRGY